MITLQPSLVSAATVHRGNFDTWKYDNNSADFLHYNLIRSRLHITLFVIAFGTYWNFA